MKSIDDILGQDQPKPPIVDKSECCICRFACRHPIESPPDPHSYCVRHFAQFYGEPDIGDLL